MSEPALTEPSLTETGLTQTAMIELRGVTVSYLGEDAGDGAGTDTGSDAGNEAGGTGPGPDGAGLPDDGARRPGNAGRSAVQAFGDGGNDAARSAGATAPPPRPQPGALPTVLPTMQPTVLHEVDLSIAPGETVLVTGPSGCGKTTLLRCINGLVPGFFGAALTGTVTVDGTPVADCPTRDLAWRVGTVFQDPRSEFFTLDVTSELAFSCENYAVPAEQVASRVEAVARRLGITHLLGRRIHGLSSGERQKVAIGTVLVLEPQVLLLDEPSANLDDQGLAVLGEVISRLKAQGVTVVVADHRITYLAHLVDRCVVMREGRVAAELSGEQLRAAPPQWFTEQGLRQPHQPQVGYAEPEPLHSPGLRVAGAEAAYPGSRPLWHVDELELPAAGVIGVTGANGTGKTTLMKVLLGLLRSRGHVTWQGRRWSRRARRRSCALVMQDVEYQLVGETLTQELLIGSVPGPRTRARAEELLERTGLAGLAHRHPLALSGGQKQRLGIALACMKQARVVFLDEPTSGLDAASMRLVSTLLTELTRSGTLVLVITHDQEFARLTFDHCLRIEDSRITYTKLLWKEQE